MSCQCHQVGGPFIAEDPDCVIHGRAATDREADISNAEAVLWGDDSTEDQLRLHLGRMIDLLRSL